MGAWNSGQRTLFCLINPNNLGQVTGNINTLTVASPVFVFTDVTLTGRL